MSSRERFVKFEQEHSLFDIEIDGIPIWERLRFGIFREIQQQSGTGQAHTSIEFSTTDQLKGAKLWLRNLFFRNPYLAPESDLLFFGHPRRKKRSDGYWWDIYCDPIHEQGSLDSVHFEKPYLLEHRTPAKTESIRYLEFITYGGTIQRKLGMHDISFTTETEARLTDIEEDVKKQFDTNIDLVSKVRRLLRNRRSRLWLYKRLLEKVDPKVAVVVVSYGKETFIEACKNKDIPVVELQHGVIHPDHLGYAYPGDWTKQMFPDYLFVWGDFWKEQAEFPIPDERVRTVGYPYLEQTVQQYEDVQSRKQLLFISQGTIGEQLSKFALEVNQHPDIDYDVVYKLHPSEYDRWQEEYPWLVDADFEVIDSSEPPLYQLFAESSVQVGVYSTALYEGLAFGLETYIYDCSGSDILDLLIEEGSATLIPSVDELASSLGTNRSSFDGDCYFAPGATERICEILDRLVDEGMPHQI